MYYESVLQHLQSLFEYLVVWLVSPNRQNACNRYFHSDTSFIWDSNIFSHIVNDLEYFSSIQLISDKARQEIKEELLLLLDELENFARKGKFESDNEVNIYISNINFEATYSYVESSNVHLSMIRVYAINSITTQDIEMCKSLKEWIQSLKKFSTLISVSGEMQRIQFFQKQREIIDTL